MTDLFSQSDVVSRVTEMLNDLDAMPLDERIEAINQIRLALHDHSPFAAEPVDCVLWVSADQIAGNDYNPNTVAPPEMRLLARSIQKDGYTQPIVAYPDHRDDGHEWTVIDGFHRHRVGREDKRVRERVKGYLPITAIKADRHDVKDRMAATIRHNRARGVHGVLPMTDIISDLILQGWTDEEVAKELGMDADEVLRFKQISGMPELFKKHDYSKAWE